MLCQKMTERAGQQVVIDNRSGVGTHYAAQTAAARLRLFQEKNYTLSVVDS